MSDDFATYRAQLEELASELGLDYFPMEFEGDSMSAAPAKSWNICTGYGAGL